MKKSKEKKEKKKVLLAGGRGRKNLQLVEKIEEFGVEVTHVWDSDEIARKTSAPQVDFVLVLRDVIGHSDELKVKKLFATEETPIFTTGKNRFEIAEAIAKAFGHATPRKSNKPTKSNKPSKSNKPDKSNKKDKGKIRGSRSAKTNVMKTIKTKSTKKENIPFAKWVSEVERIRGKPLTSGDAYAPMKRASEQETWYDVWLSGASPLRASRMGSRNLI